MVGVGRGEAGAHFSFNLEGRQMSPGRAGCWCSSALCPSCLEQYFAAELGSRWCCDHVVRELAAPAWGDQQDLAEEGKGSNFFFFLKKKKEAKEPLIEEY